MEEEQVQEMKGGGLSTFSPVLQADTHLGRLLHQPEKLPTRLKYVGRVEGSGKKRVLAGEEADLEVVE